MAKFVANGSIRKKKPSNRRAVWIKRSIYKKLQLLVFEHDGTNLMYWANKGLEHSLNDGTLK